MEKHKDGVEMYYAEDVREWHEWLYNAKQPETRGKRIEETVRLAKDNIRANHYRQPKNSGK